jgi:hypothetical protein
MWLTDHAETYQYIRLECLENFPNILYAHHQFILDCDMCALNICAIL